MDGFLLFIGGLGAGGGILEHFYPEIGKYLLVEETVSNKMGREKGDR